MIQSIVMIIVFVITFLSAFWIGTVISAILGTKLGKTVRGKDVGRALSIIIVLPMIAIMYALVGGGLIKALADPATSGTVRAVLSFLPSSWGAEIFVAFASNPGDIGAVGLETITRLGGLVIFFLAALWLGAKAANRAYSLDSTTFTVSKAKPDGPFYKTIRQLGGGGSSGTLLVTSFKEYGRRLENLSWLFYSVALVAMLAIFLSDPLGGPKDVLEGLSVMAISFLTGFSVGTVSRGKDTLFLYKKSPNGLSMFLRAKLLQNWLVAVPIIAVIMCLMTLSVPQVTVFAVSANVIVGSLRAMVTVILFLGLALVIPVFAEESRERAFGVVINLMIVLFATIGLEIVLSRSGLSFGRIFPELDSYTAALLNHLEMTALILLPSIVLLYFGKKKLGRIE
jgi:hypothetical protein